MRVVLDAGVLASAFVLPGSNAEAVYRRVLEGHLELVTSPALLASLGRLLTSIAERPDMVADAVLQVSSLGELVRIPAAARSAEENPAHAAAAEAGAEAVVSEDPRLLRSPGAIPTLAPAALLG